jgi:glycopeptide antibiotics resistance protein
MLSFFPLPFLVGLAILAVTVIILRRKRGPAYTLCFAIFGLYTLLVIGAILFPIPFPIPFLEAPSWERTLRVIARVNLVPFQYHIWDIWSLRIVLWEVGNNILITIPIAFGISFIARLGPRDFRWLTPVLGLSLEFPQFLVSLLVGGFRTTDVTDVLLNTLGALLGYLLFRLFTWGYLRFVVRPGFKSGWFSSYLLEIANRAKGREEIIA